MSKVAPEDTVLFNATRQRFLPEHRTVVRLIAETEPVDWQRVCDIAARQKVSPLVFRNLSSCSTAELGIPSSVLDRFRACYLQNVQFKRTLRGNIARLLAHLDDLDYDGLLVKGAAHDLVVYSEPWYLISWDIDIIVRARRSDQNHSEALKSTRSRFPQVEVEHMRHHDVDMNRTVRVRYEEVWRDAVDIDCAGRRVKVMCPEDMLLASCINSCRRRFFYLKTLCDVAEIAARWPDMDWKAFVAKAKRWRCERIAYAALLSAQMTVGVAVPQCVLESLVGPRFTRWMLACVCRWASRHSLSFLNSGVRLRNTALAPSLLLPYAVYGPAGLFRNARVGLRVSTARPGESPRQKPGEVR